MFVLVQRDVMEDFSLTMDRTIDVFIIFAADLRLHWSDQRWVTSNEAHSPFLAGTNTALLPIGTIVVYFQSTSE